jgi:hypothetical protein
LRFAIQLGYGVGLSSQISSKTNACVCSTTRSRQGTNLSNRTAHQVGGINLAFSIDRH